eukprot:scaffold19892_cov124-Isochrysis_galbana.AAC.2
MHKNHKLSLRLGDKYRSAGSGGISTWDSIDDPPGTLAFFGDFDRGALAVDGGTLLRRLLNGRFEPLPLYGPSVQPAVVPCVSPKLAARLAGLVGVARVRPFQMPRFGPDGEIPKATAGALVNSSRAAPHAAR